MTFLLRNPPNEWKLNHLLEVPLWPQYTPQSYLGQQRKPKKTADSFHHE
jgi:hypothetical protein